MPNAADTIYRKKSNLSAEDISKITWMLRDMLYTHESGNRQLTTSFLLTLADLYDISISDMLGTKHASNRNKSESFEI